MQYTTLGKTGLKVSVAGLGTGGFSRLGLRTGKSEDQSARLIHEAVGLGINFIDTAPSYGTEPVVGKALRSIPRASVVIATKSAVRRGGEMMTPEVGDYMTLPSTAHGKVLVHAPGGVNLLSNTCRHRQGLLLDGKGRRKSA